MKQHTRQTPRPLMKLVAAAAVTVALVVGASVATAPPAEAKAARCPRGAVVVQVDGFTSPCVPAAALPGDAGGAARLAVNVCRRGRGVVIVRLFINEPPTPSFLLWGATCR